MKRLCAAVFVALTSVSCSSTEKLNQSWPTVAVQDIDGNQVDSAQLFHQRTTIVTMWSTTCVPCRAELPQLQKFASSHSEYDAIAINLGDTPKSVTQFVNEIGLTLPIAIDFEGRVASALGVASVPATLILSSSGEVTGTHLGEISAEELAILAETSS